MISLQSILIPLPKVDKWCFVDHTALNLFKTVCNDRYLVEKYRSSKVSCLNQFPGEKQWTDSPWVDRSSVFRPRTPDAKSHGKSFNLRDSKTRSDDYDEAASDSSEDLFDLPKHHLMAAAAGLPLYKANMI